MVYKIENNKIKGWWEGKIKGNEVFNNVKYGEKVVLIGLEG